MTEIKKMEAAVAEDDKVKDTKAERVKSILEHILALPKGSHLLYNR